MKIELLAQERENIYTSYIDNHTESTIYHTLEWRDVIKKTYGFNPLYFICVNDKNQCNGALPMFDVSGYLKGKRMISIPFSHAVPMIADQENIKELLFDFIVKNYLPDRQYVEFRDTLPNSRYANMLEKKEHVAATINLASFSSIEAYWKTIHDMNRRNIKKAQKSITIKVANDLEAHQNFYKIIKQTRTRQGAPVYPSTLFQNIFQVMANKQKSMIFNAFCNDKLFAAIMVFYHNNKALYAYGGSFNDPEVRLHRPMNLLLWEAIKYSFDQGHSHFELGSSPKFHTGLIRFKEQFVKEFDELTYTVISNKPLKEISRNSRMGNIVSLILQKSPEFVNSVIGPTLLKEGV